MERDGNQGDKGRCEWHLGVENCLTSRVVRFNGQGIEALSSQVQTESTRLQEELEAKTIQMEAQTQEAMMVVEKLSQQVDKEITLLYTKRDGHIIHGPMR